VTESVGLCQIHNQLTGKKPLNKWPLLLGSCNASTSLARVLTENQLKFIARACQTIRGCSHKNASEKQCHHSNHLWPPPGYAN